MIKKTKKTTKITNTEEMTTSLQITEQKEEENFYKQCKICTEVFFKYIKYNLKHSDIYNLNKVTFTDIQCDDSIVQFHITECPGWLFGIWWGQPEKTEISGEIRRPIYLLGTFFAQFEEIIDKFKPSHSAICYDFSIRPDDDPETIYNLMDESSAINFIHFYPTLAFCRDYLGWDYNLGYHSIEEATQEYQKYYIWNDNKIKYTMENDKKILDFVKMKILPLFKNATIIDRGECWTPRYDICAPAKDNHIRPGCYEWFGENENEANKIIEEYDKLVQECKNISDQYEFYWFEPFSKTIEFIHDKKK